MLNVVVPILLFIKPSVNTHSGNYTRLILRVGFQFSSERIDEEKKHLLGS